MLKIIGHLIQAHIPPVSNCKDTGEEHSSFQNSKHTKHTHATWVKTQHSTMTTQPTLNNTIPFDTKHGFNQMAPPVRTFTVALDMSKDLDAINILTLIIKLLQTNILDTSIKFIENYIKGRKAYTAYRHHTCRQRQFKLAFHKVASFHPHYLTFKLQTYHHPVHWFRSWPTQMTSPSHLHTQARVQPRNTYNLTHIKFLPGQNKTISH